MHLFAHFPSVPPPPRAEDRGQRTEDRGQGLVFFITGSRGICVYKKSRVGGGGTKQMRNKAKDAVREGYGNEKYIYVPANP